MIVDECDKYELPDITMCTNSRQLPPVWLSSFRKY